MLIIPAVSEFTKLVRGYAIYISFFIRHIPVKVFINIFKNLMIQIQLFSITQSSNAPLGGSYLHIRQFLILFQRQGCAKVLTFYLLYPPGGGVCC